LACGLSLAGNVGSNTAGGMDICLLYVLRVVRWTCLRLAENSSGGVLPGAVCLSVPLGLSKREKGKQSVKEEEK